MILAKTENNIITITTTFMGNVEQYLGNFYLPILWAVAFIHMKHTPQCHEEHPKFIFAGKSPPNVKFLAQVFSTGKVG